MRVAINGFGRIGRSVFRILNDRPDIEIVAINDLFDNEVLEYLLKYDSVMKKFDQEVKLEGDYLVTPNERVKMLSSRNPEELPWKELNIDVVVESTGVFRKRAQIEAHIKAGAKRVILTVPAKDEIDSTIVMGVNEEELKPEHQIISNASCTTNCLAPVAKVINDNFKIVEGIITTTHAYTNDQRLADVPHSDWRRGRMAAENIIPTTTGAARAVGKVIPELNGKLDGMAARVPVPNGSVVDFVCEVEKEVTLKQLLKVMKAAASEGVMSQVLEYSDKAIVSTDIIGNPHSSVFDAEFAHVIDKNVVRVLSWYDNEWGYSNRVVDLISKLKDF